MSGALNRVAAHVAELPKSGIRKFFDIVAQSKDVVSLGVGEPDFDTPWHISRAAVTALENGATHYTSNLGTPDLRQAICRYLDRRFGAKFDWKGETLVTVGVSEAIDLAIRAIAAPGDEILYHEPCFVSYAPTIRLAHATPVAVETRVEDAFRLTVEALEAKVTSRTKALLLNFPCNPTGATLSREEMQEILGFCESHDLLLLADEVYSELNYETVAAERVTVDAESFPRQYKKEIPSSERRGKDSASTGTDLHCSPSLSSFASETAHHCPPPPLFSTSSPPLTSFASFSQYHDRVILLNGFSKSWAMTGYRLGYACGPADVIDAMMKIHQYGIMSAPTLSQAAGVEAMDHGDADVDRMRREYRRRRDYLVPALNAMGLRTLMPKGAFYLFTDIRSTGLDDETFALRLLKEHGVAVVPGSAFGRSGVGFVRLSYATSMEKLKLAVKRLGDFVERGRKEVEVDNGERFLRKF